VWNLLYARRIQNTPHYCGAYGVATVSRIDKSLGIFCRISSLLQGFFAKETYNFKEPTSRIIARRCSGKVGEKYSGVNSIQNTPQHKAPHCTTCTTLHYTDTHRNTPRHTETHCNTLQHTATHCNTLQHTVTHCDINFFEVSSSIIPQKMRYF